MTSANKIPTDLTTCGRYWQPNDLQRVSHYLANGTNGNCFAQLPTYLIGLFNVVVSLFEVCILFPISIAIWIMCEKLVKRFPGSRYVVLQETHSER